MLASYVLLVSKMLLGYEEALCQKNFDKRSSDFGSFLVMYLITTVWHLKSTCKKVKEAGSASKTDDFLKKSSLNFVLFDEHQLERVPTLRSLLSILFY